MYYNEDISISGIFTQNLEENEVFQKFSSRLSEIEQRQDQVDSDVSELTTSFADISIAELMENVNENQKKIEELSQQLNSDLTTLAEQAIEGSSNFFDPVRFGNKNNRTREFGGSK